MDVTSRDGIQGISSSQSPSLNPICNGRFPDKVPFVGSKNLAVIFWGAVIQPSTVPEPQTPLAETLSPPFLTVHPATFGAVLQVQLGAGGVGCVWGRGLLFGVSQKAGSYPPTPGRLTCYLANYNGVLFQAAEDRGGDCAIRQRAVHGSLTQLTWLWPCRAGTANSEAAAWRAAWGGGVGDE